MKESLFRLLFKVLGLWALLAVVRTKRRLLFWGPVTAASRTVRRWWFRMRGIQMLISWRRSYAWQGRLYKARFSIEDGQGCRWHFIRMPRSAADGLKRAVFATFRLISPLSVPARSRSISLDPGVE
jgi:hypothetical protein